VDLWVFGFVGFLNVQCSYSYQKQSYCSLQKLKIKLSVIISSLLCDIVLHTVITKAENLKITKITYCFLIVGATRVIISDLL